MRAPSRRAGVVAPGLLLVPELTLGLWFSSGSQQRVGYARRSRSSRVFRRETPSRSPPGTLSPVATAPGRHDHLEDRCGPRHHDAELGTGLDPADASGRRCHALGLPHPRLRRDHCCPDDGGSPGAAGRPGTPSAWETPVPASAQGRLVLSGGFIVIDREQRRLHDRVFALGFADLAGYLVARCHQQTSLALLASELGTTTVVGCRLLDHAGLTHHPAGSAPPASVAAPPTSTSPSEPPSSGSLIFRHI
jgi:hypothetical protein